MEVSAWIILRIVYAWMFLVPIPGLLRNWNSTKGLTKLLFADFATSFLTVVMICVMFFGALAILLGICGQLAGFALLVYCLLGVRAHFQLATTAQKIQLSPLATIEDKQKLESAIQLATVGNITSGQKNFVLAAVACFFMLLGTGPDSLMSVNLVDLLKQVVTI